MAFRFSFLAVAVALLATTGCGKPQANDGPVAESAAKNDAAPAKPKLSEKQLAEANQLKSSTGTPSEAVGVFFDAVQSGDENRATLLLTDVAREMTSAEGFQLATPGSSTAKFKINETEFITPENDAAHVSSTLTDFDQDGQPISVDIIWVLTKQEFGWRVKGLITADKVVIDFEDPQSMLAQTEETAEGEQAAEPAGNTPRTTQANTHSQELQR